MASVADVARIVRIEPEKVKRWSSQFAEYLSLTACPQKGQARQFSEADLRVFAVIAEHLEGGNDADDVRYALNSGQQYAEPLIELVGLHCPLFQNPPEEMDETWQHGTLIGGMAFRNISQVARAYKLAADELLTQSQVKYESHELDYPILFLYRHTIEVYLKAALDNPPAHHDLSKLIQLLEDESGQKISGWVRERLWDFHQIDRMAALFRYADSPAEGELWVDFHHLQVVIGKLVTALELYIEQKQSQQQ